MKKMKRIACLALCIAMAMATACSGGNSSSASTSGSSSAASGGSSNASSAASGSSTAAPEGGDTAAVDYSSPEYISKEVIKPSFFLTSDGYDGTEIVWETIKKYTNIEFQVIPVPLASYNEKLATTLSSGNIPDIMGCRGATTVDKYGPQGAFLCFEPYIEKGMMPNFVDILNEKEPAMVLATSPDGKRYGAPRIYMTPRMDESLLVRLDVLEKLGLSREAETFDDLIDILKKMKEAYPDSGPYFSRWETSHLIAGPAWMMNTSYTFFYNPDTNQYDFGPAMPAYKETLQFLNTLYTNNLLAKDFATLSSEEYDERLINNTGLMTFDYQNTDFYEASKSLMDPDWNWGSMLPPKYNGKRYGYPVLEGYYGYTKAISSKTKYPEEMIRFIDWTYSQQGQDALMFGVEGETYEKNADGTINMKADIKYAGNESGTILKHGLNDQNIFSVLPASGAEFFENVGQFTIAQKKYLTENNAFGTPSISAKFTDESAQKKYSDARTQIETYILEQSTKVIQGELSVDEWDKVIDTVKNTYGMEEALKLIQDAFADTLNR